MHMEPSQPIIRTRRRTRATDRALSRFVDSQTETGQAPATTNAVSSTESISTPQELPNVAKTSSDPLESLTSASAQNGDDARHAETFASQLPLAPSQEPVPSTLPDPTSAQRRYKHNPITYKRRRSMRTRAVSVSVSVSDPSTQLEPPREPSQNQSHASTQPQLLDNADEPSPPPSPSPAPPSTQSYSPTPIPAHTRKRRRRRLPPLKNRLARVARSRLVRVRSREKWSQSSVPAPVPATTPSEYGEEELDVEPEQANVARRRLVAPENYTIPDLKDLVNSSSKPSVRVLATQPLRPTTQPAPAATQHPNTATPHNPRPRFVLPQRNTVHAPRTPHGSKSPRKPKKGDAPRLNFVALEAHQEQATTRRGTSVMRKLPLTATPQTSPTRKTVTYELDEIQEISRPFEGYSNRSLARSPCRVLVKSTPEPEQLCVPKLLDFTSAAAGQRIQAPEPETEPVLEASSTNGETQPRPSHSLAPMSELYDNLVKLARSAEQMGKQIFPPAPEPFNNLKRKFQTTLTPQLTLEVVHPAKVPRLE